MTTYNHNICYHERLYQYQCFLKEVRLSIKLLVAWPQSVIPPFIAKVITRFISLSTALLTRSLFEYRILRTFVIMKLKVFFILAVVLCASTCYGSDLIVGTSFNARLAWTHKANFNAVPFIKRVKEVFYSDPGQQMIKVNF